MTLFLQLYLVDGFNPFEKYESKWEIFPRVGVKKKIYLSCHHLVICLTQKKPSIQHIYPPEV